MLLDGLLVLFQNLSLNKSFRLRTCNNLTPCHEESKHCGTCGGYGGAFIGAERFRVFKLAVQILSNLKLLNVHVLNVTHQFLASSSSLPRRVMLTHRQTLPSPCSTSIVESGSFMIGALPSVDHKVSTLTPQSQNA